MSPQLNIATLLTWLRIAAIPLVVLVFYLPLLIGPYSWSRPAAALVFTVAAITDWLDGYLARRLNQTSAFGAFLDPVADKLMVTTVLVIIVQADPQAYLAITAAIIIGRELTISALREWMSEARSTPSCGGFRYRQAQNHPANGRSGRNALVPADFRLAGVCHRQSPADPRGGPDALVHGRLSAISLAAYGRSRYQFLTVAVAPLPLPPLSAGVAQLVERNLAKVEVDGSNPFARSNKNKQLDCFQRPGSNRVFVGAPLGLLLGKPVPDLGTGASCAAHCLIRDFQSAFAGFICPRRFCRSSRARRLLDRAQAL